jgi:hypothetical protein
LSFPYFDNRAECFDIGAFQWRHRFTGSRGLLRGHTSAIEFDDKVRAASIVSELLDTSKCQLSAKPVGEGGIWPPFPPPILLLLLPQPTRRVKDRLNARLKYGDFISVSTGAVGSPVRSSTKSLRTFLEFLPP